MANTTDKTYALLIEREDGEQIAFLPDNDADWSVSSWRRNPSEGDKTWDEIIARDVSLAEGESYWEDSHAKVSRGPVAVAVSESDKAEINRYGRSRPLLQKLVRALDKVDGVSEHLSLNADYVTLRRYVQGQDKKLLLSWVTDGRTKAARKAEKAPETAEKHEGEELTEEQSEDASEHYGFLKGYKHRDVVEGIEDFEMMEYALQNRENVLLMGPTQSGKSTLPIAFAEHKKLPVFLLAGNVAMEPSQIFGKFIPQNDGTFAWTDGMLTKLVRDGGVLVLDEVNVISPKIMTTLYSLLDNRREITLLDHKGEVIKAHKNLLVVATCNIGYQGTLPMSEALLDRFAHRHHWDYSNEVEAQLIKSANLRKMAQDLRKDGSLRTPLSTSLLKSFEKLATSQLGWDYAAANLLGRFTDPEDREVVAAVLNVHAEDIKVDLGLTDPKPGEKEEAPKVVANSRSEWRDILNTWAS